MRGQHDGKHRGHRIAGARHVAYLDRIGRDVQRATAISVERQAGFTACHQHRLALDHARHLLRRRNNVGIARERSVGGIGQLLAVRRDQGGAAIDAKVETFGIDHHRLAELFRSVDHAADEACREDPLGIVGEHHAIRPRQRSHTGVDQRVLDVRADRRGQFPVGTQQVGRMVLGDKAHFARGRAAGIDHEMGFDRRTLLA